MENKSKSQKIISFIERKQDFISMAVAMLGLLISLGLVLVPIIIWKPIDYFALGFAIGIFSLIIVGSICYVIKKSLQSKRKSKQKLENDLPKKKEGINNGK